MKPLPDSTPLDFTTLRRLYGAGGTDAATPSQVVDLVYRRLAREAGSPVWIHLEAREAAMARAMALEAAAEGKDPFEIFPLYGVPFAVKDNIDVAGRPTTAGCPAYSRIAGESAFAVERILADGGIFIGKTNLDQFASGLVGTRTPYGRIRNPFHSDYIPGGSSSGSAVAVAMGLVAFALGTDTAGSGRVPAAFNNIVGLKPSRGLISCSGVVPACRSLDCVSIFALTADEARTVLVSAMGYDPADPYSRDRDGGKTERGAAGSRFRFGTPSRAWLRFFGDGDAARIYDSSLATLKEMGGTPVEIDFAPFREAADLLYNGPFVAERLEAPETLLRENPDALHPILRKILEKARNYSALDLFQSQASLNALRRRAEEEWRKMDVLALPTAGTIYSFAELEADPVELNANLGYYTNFVNLLDACGLSLPSGFRSDGLPTGITLLAPAMEDDFICGLGARFQRFATDPPGIPRADSGVPSRSSRAFID